MPMFTITPKFPAFILVSAKTKREALTLAKEVCETNGSPLVEEDLVAEHV